jgi:hypothetical protein
MATGVKPKVTITPGDAGVPNVGLVDLMMATDVETAGLVDLTMGNDVVPAVTVTPGAAGVPIAGLVDLTMATDVNPAVAGSVKVLATDRGVSDVLLGKHHRDYFDADITDDEERKKRNDGRTALSVSSDARWDKRGSSRR